MPQSFKCPSCNAPLELTSEALTVRCEYCGTTVIVPDEFRSASAFDANAEQDAIIHEIIDLVHQGKKIEAIKLYRETYNVGLKEAKAVVERLAATQIGVTQSQSSGCTSIIVFFILVAVGIAAAAVFLLNENGDDVLSEFTDSDREVGQTVQEVLESMEQAETEPTPSPTPGFAEVDLSFGNEGIGAGFFDDARHIGVDGDGNIYVGEYSSGRIQVFDSEGEFINQWMPGNDTPLRTLEVDREGNVYIIWKGDIYKHDGQDGSLLTEFAYSGSPPGFDESTTLTANGNLVAMHESNQAKLFVHFDAQGQVVETIALQGGYEFPFSATDLAIDGLGNYYVLVSGSQTAVFKYGPDGQLLDQISSQGNEPGQLTAPNAIAVDGQGRIFVSDFKGIQVFSPDGRYLDVIEVRPISDDFVFTGDGQLVTVARTQVLRFSLNN